MKKLFFLFILLPFLSVAQTDTTLSENGSITSINEKGIDALVSKYENILKAKNGVEGWRVQIMFKTKKEEIQQLKITFIKLYPKIPAYLEYDAPYYRVRVGNCRTKLEAIKIQRQISKHFPGAYPVPEIINFSQLKH
jgi:hypothetical protein